MYFIMGLLESQVSLGKFNRILSKSEKYADKAVNGMARLKHLNIYLSFIYTHLHDFSKSSRISSCCDYLEYHSLPNNRAKLSKASFCCCRLCALCNSRRRYKNFVHASKVFDVVLRDYDYRYLFVTLSRSACSGEKLRSEVDKLNVNFRKKFLRYKKVSKFYKGFIKCVEVTYNADNDTYHPHLHVVLAVSSNYFCSSSKLFLSHAEFLNLWSKANDLEDNGDVSCYLSVIHSSEKRSSLREIVKYSLKTSQYLTRNFEQDLKVVRTLTYELHNKQFFSCAGVFYDVSKKLNLDFDENRLLEVSDEKDVGNFEIFKYIFREFSYYKILDTGRDF